MAWRHVPEINGIHVNCLPSIKEFPPPIPGQTTVMRPSESLNHELQGSVYIVWRGQKTSVSDACRQSKVLRTLGKYPFAQVSKTRSSILIAKHLPAHSPAHTRSSPPWHPGAPPCCAA